MQSYAQEKIHVPIYFENGSSKIQDQQIDVLNSIHKKLPFSILDSVHFIGMADSVGNYKSNLKLSEKRAKITAKYCAGFLPTDIPIRISALGENNNIPTIEKNRRVDIFLFYSLNDSITPDEKQTTEKGDDCYYINYSVINKANISTYKQGNKELILIETEEANIQHLNNLYSGTINNGKLIVKKIKWSSKTTGRNWWTKKRYITAIPKKDFESFKIFNITKPPCEKCSEDFKHTVKIKNEDNCAQVDNFLMYNIQIKSILFNSKSVKIRAPREYVDLNTTYFIGCNLENKLQWENKKGRKGKKYYYSMLPRKNYHLENITKIMSCCKTKPEPFQCDKPLIYLIECKSMDRNYKLIGEIGSYYQQSDIVPYAEIGIFKAGFSNQITLLVGTDKYLGVNGSLRYQYNFLSFPYSKLNPAKTWQSPTNNLSTEQYGELYIGTELKTKIKTPKTDYLEQNIHIGFAAVNTKWEAIIPRIFIQYGVGYDYLKNNSSELYPIAQVGMIIKIIRLN